MYSIFTRILYNFAGVHIYLFLAKEGNIYLFWFSNTNPNRIFCSIFQSNDCVVGSMVATATLLVIGRKAYQKKGDLLLLLQAVKLLMRRGIVKANDNKAD